MFETPGIVEVSIPLFHRKRLIVRQAKAVVLILLTKIQN